jgi:hypothetical protein
VAATRVGTTTAYPNCCISCTRTEEILETPNSTVWPGYNSIATKSLKVSSDDESAGGAFAADEEETTSLPEATAKGALPALEATAHAPAKDLVGPGMAVFAVGGGLLLPGVVDFAPPRALFTSRLGSPTLVNARRFRAAS